MENQVNEQGATTPTEASGYNATLWDGLSGVALIGGAIAGGVTGNVAAGVVPVAAAVGLHMVNRHQLQSYLLESQAAASTQVVNLVNQNQATIQEYLQKFQSETQASLAQQQQAIADGQTALTQALDAKATELNGQLTAFQTAAEQTHANLDEKHQTLVDVVNELRQMENCSHTIEADPKADAYYQRGLSHKRLGDRSEAVRDFSEAIRLNGELADAYYHRGIVYAELGTRKLATDDLRLAYKLYFDQGDLDNYDRARQLHKEFYDGTGQVTEDLVAAAADDASVNGHEAYVADNPEQEIKPLLEQESETTAANLFG
jgi:tetratricopeptide (TPR) repeat protein